MRVLLVVPCYKESERLPLFLPSLCAAMDEIGETRILVVDDGSGLEETAATREIVDQLRPRHVSLLPLLEEPTNLGKGGAIYAGWAEAGNADLVGFVDADGSCSARETARLIGLARQHLQHESATAFFASRVKMLGRKVERQFKRHLLGRIYATLVSECLDIPVYDSQCGLKLVPRKAYDAIAGRLVVQGFAFDVELLVNLIDHGVKVVEVPIDWHETPGGKVRLLRDSLSMARDVLRIRQRRQHQPGLDPGL